MFLGKITTHKSTKKFEFKSRNQLKSHNKRVHYRGWQFLRKFDSKRNRFNIPQGSRKIKSIPKGSSGNFRECNFLNLPQCSMLIKRKFKIFFSILHNFEKFLTAWWSENHYEKKVHPKFFQNPFLGCPWVV